MHFFYLDEAGCTGSDLENKEQPVFVLGGISVRDEGWIKTQESLSAILGDYFNKSVPHNFELHANELLSPKGEKFFQDHDRVRRNELAKRILNITVKRKHHIHMIAIDKSKLKDRDCDAKMSYDTKVPYLLACDYLITYINWILEKNLGRTARGMLIVDIKEQYHEDIERITRTRRFEGPVTHRIKRVVEFSYPIDSQKNSMIQISDLVVYCVKKFMEINNGYRDNYNKDATRFFAECYEIIQGRICKNGLVERKEPGMHIITNHLKSIVSKPIRKWKERYLAAL